MSAPTWRRHYLHTVHAQSCVPLTFTQLQPEQDWAAIAAAERQTNATAAISFLLRIMIISIIWWAPMLMFGRNCRY